MTPTAKIYWDSCVIIDYLQQTAGRYATLQEIIEEARSGAIQLVTSSLSIAEVFKIDPSNPPSPQDIQRIDDFFENEYVHVRVSDRYTGRTAADIARQHGLLPPDAIHIATALKHKCTAMQTYDGSGTRPKRKHLLLHDGKIGTPPLKIEEPRTYTKKPQVTKPLEFGKP